MIHKLQLNKFGKFTRKTLEFGALTVIPSCIIETYSVA
ncbi:MAG: hypothetical protein FD189_1849 [Elusimicrobia bacterium]|nr:MAG: hypothetical protein FD154_2026 [Elusimicrobiota bacterium]KAF0154527.1 MAG: hypothetical protein FD189_1849 [Elusimicrobiota bacterium]